MTDAFDTNDFDGLPLDTVAARWGDAAGSGFVPVPNVLVRAQAKLKLTCTDMIVLLNILLHWWQRDRMPFPSTPSIARRTGLSVRTVQRSLRALEKKGLIARHRAPTSEKRRARARYDLEGLRRVLSDVAEKDVWYRPHLVRERSAEGEQVAKVRVAVAG